MKATVRVFRVFMVASTALALAASLAAGPASADDTAALPKGVPKGAEPARVWGYLDGDGFKARVGDTTKEIVLIGVDLPEGENAKGEVDCYTAEAMRHLRTFLPKKSTIYLEPDATDRDTENRLPRYVWIPGSDGAKALLLNTKLVRDGDATLAQTPDTARYHDNLVKADAQAREANRGLWAACRPPDGTWYGATAEGFPLSFEIRDRGLAHVNIAYGCANGSGYTTMTGELSWKNPLAIDRHGFAVTVGGTTFTGEFVSDFEAQGTLEFSGGRCGGTVSTTWSATR